MDVIKRYLWGKTDLTEYENGGEQCINYMSLEYKICVTFLSCIVYFTIIYNRINKLKVSSSIISPYFIEKIVGISSIITYIAQVYLKSVYSESLIFILNPCHVLLLLQAYCLLSKNTRFTFIIFYICNMNLFTGILGLINPFTNGLSEYEVYFFHIEHAQIGIINPLTMMIFDRYFQFSEFSLTNHIFGHCFFSSYQRLILFPISQLSYINLNFTICPSKSKLLILPS